VAAAAARTPSGLPTGWKKRFTSTGRRYFVDHNSRTTTHVHSRISNIRRNLQAAGSSTSAMAAAEACTPADLPFAPPAKRCDDPGTASAGAAGAASQIKPKTAAPAAVTLGTQTLSACVPLAPGSDTQQSSAAGATLAMKNVPLRAPSSAIGTNLQATNAEFFALENQVASQNVQLELTEKELLRSKDELGRMKNELDRAKNDVLQSNEGHASVLREVDELRAMVLQLQAGGAATEQANAESWNIVAKVATGLTDEAKTAGKYLQEHTEKAVWLVCGFFATDKWPNPPVGRIIKKIGEVYCKVNLSECYFRTFLLVSFLVIFLLLSSFGLLHFSFTPLN